MNTFKNCSFVVLAISFGAIIAGCSGFDVVSPKTDQSPVNPAATASINTGAIAPVYNITDLGALPGNNISIAQGLNNAGQAVGISSNTGTLFSNGSAISLGTLGVSDELFPQAINDLGLVAGYDWLSSGIAHAFLYSNGKITDIHSASLFPFGSTAQGINRSGQIVGYGWITGANNHAFSYSSGQTVDLGTLGGNESMALGINDEGQIVGHSATASGVEHAFLYSSGKMADLGMPSGAVSSSALAINHAGQIVGEIGINASSHAALYNGGVWTDLGTVSGATLGALATGINDAGQIVGQATFPKVLISPASPGKRAKYTPSFRVGFVVQNGVPTDLNSLVPAKSGFAITGAVGINNSGVILCNAKTSTSASRAVLLTPR